MSGLGKLSLSTIVDVSADLWGKDVLRSDVLTIVNFWHQGCAWCRMLDPVYRDVAEEFKGKVRFFKIDAMKSDANRDLAMKYGVMGTPTLIFFCNGRPIESAAGFKPKDQLRQLVNNILERYQDCFAKSTEFQTG